MSQRKLQESSMVERLRMENDFMKMKLMLEYGARFPGKDNGNGLDPATEYAFLKQILAFEEENAIGRRKTVYEKLGKPVIRPSAQVPEGDLPSAIADMHRKLNTAGIYLTTLSKQVHPRELYRFITEELMQVELSAAESPGRHCFVYDDFHPDPHHQNEQTAKDLCIRLILQKKNLLHMFPAGRPLRLNDHERLNETAFRQKIHAFKSRYEDIVSIKLDATRTELRGDTCRVEGTHVTGLCLEGKCDMVSDKWQVEFRRDQTDEWLVVHVQIDGIEI